MKLKTFLIHATLLLSAAASVVPGARAGVTSNTGDLILAFRTKDNANAFDLEVDLGPVANFLSVTPGGTLQLNLGASFYGSTGGLSAQDLRSVYGDGSTNSSWDSLSDLYWSVAGTNGAAGGNTIWVTFPGTTANQALSQSGVAGRINTEYSTLSGTSGLTSPQAGDLSASLPGSYSIQIRNGNGGSYTKDYNYFTPTTEAPVTSTGSSSAAFYQLSQGTGAGTDLGTFSLGSDGTFTYIAAVPEPTTSMALAIGAGALILLRRRRSQKA